MTSVVSLFSGVGGFDLGFEQAGFTTTYQCEIDQRASDVLHNHWPTVPKWRDVTTLTAREILAHDATPDVVIWGSPCQDLSVAGRRAGIRGGKSSLFFDGMRVINELREGTDGRYPRATVWENVAGALTSSRGRDFAEVIDQMAEAGALVVEWAVLDAQHFGVPQRRRRVFVVAIFDPASAERCPDPLLPVGTVAERNHSEDGLVTFYSSQGRHDRFTRGIFSAVKTAGTSCIASDDIAPRRLTPIECERLMGWPDDWTSGQPNGHRYRQCGNGVVAPVARWVATHLKAVL